MMLACSAGMQSLAKTPQDSTRTDHLIVKLELLTSLISSSVNGYESSFALGGAVEYRINQKYGLQMAADYYRNEERYYWHRNHYVAVEARRYLKHHFVGAYIKFNNYQSLNPTPGIVYGSDELYFAPGIIYGYQRIFGKVSVEGRLGAGLPIGYYRVGPVGIGRFDVASNDYILDILLGIFVGYRIF